MFIIQAEIRAVDGRIGPEDERKPLANDMFSDNQYHVGEPPIRCIGSLGSGRSGKDGGKNACTPLCGSFPPSIFFIHHAQSRRKIARQSRPLSAPAFDAAFAHDEVKMLEQSGNSFGLKLI